MRGMSLTLSIGVAFPLLIELAPSGDAFADSSERWPGELVRAGHRRVRHLPRIRRRSYRSIIRVSKSGSESMSTPDDSRRGGPAGTTTTS